MSTITGIQKIADPVNNRIGIISAMWLLPCDITIGQVLQEVMNSAACPVNYFAWLTAALESNDWKTLVLRLKGLHCKYQENGSRYGTKASFNNLSDDYRQEMADTCVDYMEGAEILRLLLPTIRWQLHRTGTVDLSAIAALPSDVTRMRDAWICLENQMHLVQWYSTRKGLGGAEEDSCQLHAVAAARYIKHGGDLARRVLEFWWSDEPSYVYPPRSREIATRYADEANAWITTPEEDEKISKYIF
jgi:hypothetical protein